MAGKKKEGFEPVNLKPLIKLLAKEKDLEPEVIKIAVESAILSAAQKRAKSFEDARPILDLDTGELRMYVKKKVVVRVEDEKHEIDIISAKSIKSSHMLNEVIDVEIDPEEFGRIAAQSVRQGILQRLREAERDRVYNEYKDKMNEVITVTVQRYEKNDCVVLHNKVECLMPRPEMPMGAKYRYNDRLRCLIVDVRKVPKGPQVIVSRNRSELVKQLFETEVPEIHDGTVRIVEIAREPGIRTKIAVSSMEATVDPVGACVGMKGSRVQMIVRELDNEKIDIVPYSPIPETFIKAALNPAEIVSIRLVSVERRAEVVVARESLSKAIGKRGQNAKLAARLTGWKIDITEQEDSETLARLDEINRQYLKDFLVQIEGLPEISAAAIARSSDYNSVEKLADLEPRDLLNFVGDNLELATRIVAGAREYQEGYREMVNSPEGQNTIPADAAEYLRNMEELANRLAGKAPVVSVSPDEDEEVLVDGKPIEE